MGDETVHEDEVWLGKVKYVAKALACVSACSSFNFAKRWHFAFRCQHEGLMVAGLPYHYRYRPWLHGSWGKVRPNLRFITDLKGRL